MPLGELNIDRTSVLDLAPLRGMPLSRLVASNIPELFDLNPLRGLPLRSLILVGTSVTDFSPLRGMALKELQVTGLSQRVIPNIAALRGMPLEVLQLAKVAELDPQIIAEMPLRRLMFSGGISESDLSFLTGKRLTQLGISNSKVTGLTALAGMPLENLSVARCPAIADLSPLADLPLQILNIAETGVIDLSPLRNLPLVSLNLRGCRAIQDVSVLASISTLEEVVLPPTAPVEPLRSLPNLRLLSRRAIYDSVIARERPAQTAAEFWAEYDAGKAAEKQ